MGVLELLKQPAWDTGIVVSPESSEADVARDFLAFPMVWLCKHVFPSRPPPWLSIASSLDEAVGARPTGWPAYAVVSLTHLPSLARPFLPPLSLSLLPRLRKDFLALGGAISISFKRLGNRPAPLLFAVGSMAVCWTYIPNLLCAPCSVCPCMVQ